MLPLRAALALLLCGAAHAAPARNECVACHRSQAEEPALEHTFEDWEGSRHAKAGVSCEMCHGGDPLRADAAGAHAGIAASTSTASRVYYTAIPATCGACHRPELAAFKASLHFGVLMKSERGPNCVSCHGAMAGSIIPAEDMEAACSLCHRKPTRALEARRAVDEAREALLGLDGALARAEAKGEVSEGGRQAAADLRARLAAALVAWHGFDAAKLLRQARAITADARAFEAELARRSAGR